MTLYGYWRSSASWRVRIGLELKGLDYDYVPVDLRAGAQRSAVHEARNPLHKVPVLTWTEDDRVHHLTQSMAILAWLDQQAPEPLLFPRDPATYVRAIELAEVINSGIQPLQNSSVLVAVEGLGADRTTWARDVITHGLHALQALSEPVRGPFLCGDAITVADLFLVPQLYGARRFGVDLDPFAALTAIDARLAEHPAFAKAHADRQPDADPLTDAPR